MILFIDLVSSMFVVSFRLRLKDNFWRVFNCSYLFFGHPFSDYSDVFELLLEKGANVNVVDSNNQTALVYAIKLGSISILFVC